MNTPQQIATGYISIAHKKVTQKWYKTLILAVLAGAFIAFGAALATASSTGMAGTQAALIKGAVFPVGLILVVVCGAELFTGNCLLFAPALNNDEEPVSVLKCLGLSYLGNLIGGILIALLVVYSGAMSSAVAQASVDVASAKCGLSFLDSFLRGILCNMLVCLAVWAAMASNSISGKILAVYLPIFTFVVCGFEHCVANMYYLTAGFLASSYYSISGGLSFFDAIFANLLPSTLGNIIGGCLIAAAYWAVYLKGNKNKPAQPAETNKEEDVKEK